MSVRSGRAPLTAIEIISLYYSCWYAGCNTIVRNVLCDNRIRPDDTMLADVCPEH